MANLSMEQAQEFLKLMAEEASEWAGIPVPLEGQNLVVHPSYPFARACRIHEEEQGPSPDDGADEVVNRWQMKRGVEVYVWHEGGRAKHAMLTSNTVTNIIKTLGAAAAWEVEAEIKALEMLAREIGQKRYRQYLLTGTFLETSRRSKVTYLFRKLRPTVALRGDMDTNQVRVLCVLCLHSVGYYEGSWAGAMCPTDDVLAHLLLMRADEPRFWKDSNQIAQWRPEAGMS